MLGPLDGEGMKRTQSAIDIEFELMGLSQNKAGDENSFLVEHDDAIKQLDDLVLAPPQKEIQKLPHIDHDQGFTAVQESLLLDPDNAFADLNDVGNQLRHRSQTFHYQPNSSQLDFLNSLVDTQQQPLQQHRDQHGRLSFEMHFQNNL